MPKFGKAVLLPLFASVVAATAGAQGNTAQQDCDVEEGTPSSLAMATLSLTQAQSVAAPADIAKNLQNAMGRLFTGDASKDVADAAKNPAGKAFILGKIYMVWLSLPDQAVVTTRGALGFKTDVNAVADLSKGIDSAFKVVAEKNPKCVPYLSLWRQQGGWVKLVQAAMNYANNNQIDSAGVVAQQAMTISPTAPYGHLVLGTVSAKRDKPMEAIGHYKDALAEAEKDTVFNDVRRQILYNLATFALQMADVDTGKTNKPIYLNESLNAFKALRADPGATYGDAARQGITSALAAKGDTAAIRGECQEQVDKPDVANFITLVQCGTILAQINDNAPALKLFEAANAQNPYHRDGLSNLALMQLKLQQFEKALTTIDRLVSLDPSNPDNVRLYYFAWGGIRERGRMLSDSIGKQANALPRTPANDAKRKALTDSAVKVGMATQAALNKVVEYNTAADSMPVKVSFTEFTPSTDKATIGGTIWNKTKATKSYTMNVEFLDKNGQTITKGIAVVPDVGPGALKEFTLEGKGANIVAFKYAPIDK